MKNFVILGQVILLVSIILLVEARSYKRDHRLSRKLGEIRLKRQSSSRARAPQRIPYASLSTGGIRFSSSRTSSSRSSIGSPVSPGSSPSDSSSKSSSLYGTSNSGSGSSYPSNYGGGGGYGQSTSRVGIPYGKSTFPYTSGGQTYGYQNRLLGPVPSAFGKNNQYGDKSQYQMRYQQAPRMSGYGQTSRYPPPYGGGYMGAGYHSPFYGPQMMPYGSPAMIPPYYGGTGYTSPYYSSGTSIGSPYRQSPVRMPSLQSQQTYGQSSYSSGSTPYMGSSSYGTTGGYGGGTGSHSSSSSSQYPYSSSQYPDRYSSYGSDDSSYGTSTGGGYGESSSNVGTPYSSSDTGDTGSYGQSSSGTYGSQGTSQYGSYGQSGSDSGTGTYSSQSSSQYVGYGQTGSDSVTGTYSSQGSPQHGGYGPTGSDSSSQYSSQGSPQYGGYGQSGSDSGTGTYSSQSSSQYGGYGQTGSDSSSQYSSQGSPQYGGYGQSGSDSTSDVSSSSSTYDSSQYKYPGQYSGVYDDSYSQSSGSRYGESSNVGTGYSQYGQDSVPASGPSSSGTQYGSYGGRYGTDDKTQSVGGSPAFVSSSSQSSTGSDSSQSVGYYNPVPDSSSSESSLPYQSGQFYSPSETQSQGSQVAYGSEPAESGSNQISQGEVQPVASSQSGETSGRDVSSIYRGNGIPILVQQRIRQLERDRIMQQNLLKSHDHPLLKKCTEEKNGLPDLYIDPGKLRGTLKLEHKSLYDLSCAKGEGCLAASANESNPIISRKLLKFATVAHNNGTAVFKPSLPKNKWKFHSCHKHYHSSEEFAHYNLINSTGYLLAEGHKASFCLEDSGCVNPCRPKFNCTTGDQGISPGCHDTYLASRDCQWIDVTDVPPGKYTLRVTVNPPINGVRKSEELRYDNNIVDCSVTLTPSKALAHTCAFNSK